MGGGGGGRQYSTACATPELYFCHTEINKNYDVELILLRNAPLHSSLGKKSMCIRAREYVCWWVELSFRFVSDVALLILIADKLRVCV